MFASLRIRTALVFLLSLSVPAVAGAATIALAWNANTEANVAGYRVHYGTQAGSYTTIVDRGNTLTANVTGLADGTRYYFVVVAYDTTGAQSAFSAEVNDIPPPPIDATPPVATMTAPAAGAQVSGSVALTATATDNVAVAGVTFQVDGVAAGPEDTTAPYSFTWNTTGAANGSHALRAVARDSTGTLGTSPAVTVQVLNDGTAPLILALTPAANATNVSGAAAITARFDEPLNPSTVSAANFELRTAANALVAATVSYDAATRTARLVPAAALTPGGSFDATVRGGATGIRDVAGNALATTQLWSFTVAPAPPPLTGLMAAYGFEDGTGTVAADASGMGNPGAITGATWKPGKFGSSLEFNGTSNWVTVPNSVDVNLTAALTIEAWVYPTTLTGWRTVMMKENGLNGLTYALYAHDSAPKPAAYVRLAGASSSVGASGTVQLPLNTWTHLATTFDGTSLNLYVGGVLVDSTPASGALIPSSSPLRLGGNAIWGEYFAGRIDEVRLYNRALSPSEIQADMSRVIVTANRVPVVTTPGPRTGTEGVPVTDLSISAADPDGDALAHSASGLPSGVTINTATGVISGTVGFNATASNTVVVTVHDGHGGVASTAPFSWTITLVNRAPTLTTPGPQTGTKGFAVTALAIGAADPDGDALTFGATGLPSGVAINTATGVISGTVAADASAANAVQVVVADGNGGSASASFSWTIATTAPGSGLVAAYGFDEGRGAVATDASGLGNIGTITGAGWKPGKFGKSLEFDGISDWVTVAASPGVNVTEAMTLEAWVYPTEAAGWRTVVFKEAPGEMWAHSYGLYSAFGSEGSGGHVLASAQANAHDPAALVLNQWTHLATTYDGQTLRSFVNGVERAAVAVTGPINVSNGALRLGGNGMWGDFFKGRIDEVRVYDRALPVAQIRQDMAMPVTGWLAAAYSFDDGAGSAVSDDAGRFLTGTIAGATWTPAGRFGGGLLFDGVNDSVTVADSSWLALEENMTLEAWVYPTAQGGWRSVLMKESPGWYTFALYSDGSVGPGVRALTLSDGNATSPAALPVNEWSHLAATYDGATLRLFVNGVSVATTAYTGTLATSTDPLRIGGNAMFGEYFTGVIDEVRIYYRKLSGAEIRADMTRPIR